MSRPAPDDHSWGRDRVAYNVSVAWLAHGVTLVLGFVMPRLIFERVGHELLGVWDLAWAVLSYLTVSGHGVASAVTHFVASYRAEHRSGAVTETIATAFWCQVGGAAVLSILIAFLLAGLPRWLPADFAELATELTWLAGLLGVAIFLGLVGDVLQGVLKGYHRSGINEWLTVGMDITLAAGMLLAIGLGGGVVGLAIATVAARALFEGIRLLVVLRHCPEMTVSLRRVRRERLHSIVAFGAKTTIATAQETLVQLFTRVLLVASAGPVALACYSRYATLVRQIGRGIERMAYPLPPMASSLATLRGPAELRDLSHRAERSALLLALPVIATFAVFGDAIVAVWMGPDFVVPGISAILAVMALAHADREVAARVLAGMNAHGRIALLSLVSAAVTFLALAFLLQPLDPLRAAILVAVTMTLGVYVPHYLLGCRRLGVSPSAHFRVVYSRPLACNAVFLLGLVAARAQLQAQGLLPALLTASAAAALLVLTYWRFALDAHTRCRIRTRLLGQGA